MRKAEKNNIITQESEIVRDAQYPKIIEEAYHLLTLFRNPAVVKSPSISTVAAPAKSSIATVALVATDNKKQHQKGERKTVERERKPSKEKSDKHKGSNKSNTKYRCVTCSIFGLP